MQISGRRSSGFTLPEVLMASAILAFAVVAITHAVSSGQAQTYNALHELRALSLTEALIEEIAALPYADPNATSVPGPDAGEADRAAFDNADDFHGHTETLGEIRDVNGDAYPVVFDSFSRSVTAVYESIDLAPVAGAINGLTVVVTVTDHRGRAWQASRFIPEPAQ